MRPAPEMSPRMPRGSAREMAQWVPQWVAHNLITLLMCQKNLLISHKGIRHFTYILSLLVWLCSGCLGTTQVGTTLYTLAEQSLNLTWPPLAIQSGCEFSKRSGPNNTHDWVIGIEDNSRYDFDKDNNRINRTVWGWQLTVPNNPCSGGLFKSSVDEQDSGDYHREIEGVRDDDVKKVVVLKGEDLIYTIQLGEHKLEHSLAEGNIHLDAITLSEGAIPKISVHLSSNFPPNYITNIQLSDLPACLNQSECSINTSDIGIVIDILPDIQGCDIRVIQPIKFHQDDSAHGYRTATIVLSVLSCILLIILICTCMCVRKRKAKKTPEEHD